MRRGALVSLVVVSACTSVAGLDDLVFESGTSSGGAGGAGTTSATGGGVPTGAGGTGGGTLVPGGEVVWVDVFGGSIGTELGGLGVLSDNGLIVAFDYEGTATVGPDVATSDDDRDAAVALLGPSGEYAGLLSFPGPGPQTFSGVAVGPNDAIYACLTFQNSFNIGSTKLTSVDSWDVGIVVTDAGGNPIWTESFGSTAGQDCHDIGFGEGQLIVKGALDGAASFGGETFDSEGSVDGWIGGYSLEDGAHLWSQGFGSAAPPILERPLDTGRIDVSGAQARVAMAGAFNETVAFGSDTLNSVSSVDGFVSVLTLLGEVQWSLPITGQGQQWARDVVITADGDLVVVGEFQNSVTIDTVTAPSADGFDGFVARLSPMGSVRWLRTIAGTNLQAATRVTEGPDGQIYVAGIFQNQVDGPTGPLIAVSGADTFVFRFSATGEQEWARSIGGAGLVDARELVVDHQGFLVIGGHYGATLQIDADIFGGMSDERSIYIAKLTP